MNSTSTNAALYILQASNFLNVCVFHLLHLFDTQQLKYQSTDSERSVFTPDLLQYKLQHVEARLNVLKESSAQAQKFDMGY